MRRTIADLTAKLLVNDAWKEAGGFALRVPLCVVATSAPMGCKGWLLLCEAELKPYNFFARGKKQRCGSVHPLMVVQKQFKHVLVAMGFEVSVTRPSLQRGPSGCGSLLSEPPPPRGAV